MNALAKIKQAEERLTLLNASFSKLGDVIMILQAEPLDEPGPRIIFVNDAFERLTGYTSTEALGRNPRFLAGNKTDPRIMTGIYQAMLQQRPIRRRVINYEISGIEYWLEIDVVPIFDASGKCSHFTCIGHDITKAKKTEEQLLWKSTFFEAQVHSALDGTIVVDGDARKILQNQRMIDLWNIPPWIADDLDDAPQREWCSNQLKNSRKFADKIAHLYSHPEEVSRDELELIDGRYFDQYSAPVRSESGQYYGRIWTFRDVTERKRVKSHFWSGPVNWIE